VVSKRHQQRLWLCDYTSSRVVAGAGSSHKGCGLCQEQRQQLGVGDRQEALSLWQTAATEVHRHQPGSLCYAALRAPCVGNPAWQAACRMLTHPVLATSLCV
jgi:hypothetical protein